LLLGEVILNLQCLLIVSWHRDVGLMPSFLCPTVGKWHLGWSKNSDIAIMNHASGIAVCH
jgi:hypothetical protein